MYMYGRSQEKPWLVSLFLLSLLLLISSCQGQASIDSQHVKKIDKIYSQKQEGRYQDIDRKKYDLPEALLKELTNDELAYAFFHYPFMADLVLSSDLRRMPADLAQLSLVQEWLGRDDPLGILLDYYKQQWKGVQAGDASYGEKERDLLYLDVLSSQQWMMEKATETRREELKALLKEERAEE